MAIELTNPAFGGRQPVPSESSRGGTDHPPQAVGNSRPAEAQSIALSCDDPDAPVAPWVHGEVCNIPATASGLPEAGPN